MAGTVKRDAERGTWFYVVDIGIDPATGKRRQVRKRGFATKKAAAEALAGVVTDDVRGAFVRPGKVTLEQFLVNEWLPARAGGLRPSTAASYAQLIRNYVHPTIGSTQLAKVDGAMLNVLYQTLLTEGRTEVRRGLGPGLSPKTVQNVHGMLTKAFRDAVRWGRLVRNPCDAADPPRGRSPEMAAWTADELRRFIASTAEHRWSAIWTLIATTGMRRGEVLGLRWGDVDLDAGTVTIRSTRIRYGTTVEASTPKTARGNRTIAIGPTVVAMLRGWRKRQAEERMLMGAGWGNVGDLVVTIADGTAPNPEAFSNMFRTLADRAGLRPIRLHDLRHSYATAALADGVPVKVVSQRLGHADVGVTLKVYAHVMPGDDAAAALAAEVLVTGH
jgi:integrase